MFWICETDFYNSKYSSQSSGQAKGKPPAFMHFPGCPYQLMQTMDVIQSYLPPSAAQQASPAPSCMISSQMHSSKEEKQLSIEDWNFGQKT